MVTSATIDISTYASTADTSSAKSHNDKSSDFNDIFNTVNKAFTPDKSSTSNASDAKSAKTTDEKTKTTNSSDNSDKKVDDSNKKTEDKTVEDKSNDKEVNQKTTDTDTKNKTTDSDETKKTEDSSDTKDTETSNEAQPTVDKTALDTQPTVLTNNIIEALESAVSTTITPAAVTTPTADISQTAISNTADTPSVTASNEQPSQGIAAGVTTDLTKITQNLTNNITKQASDNKVATQTQQPATSQVDQQIVQPQDLKQEAPQAVVDDTTNQIKVDAEAVVPVVIAANANVKTETNSTSKENTNEVSKTAITQDMLDKTNAKIVSVDKGSSNSNNNLLNKQNAQEQAIKFSLESNSKPESASKNVTNTELPGVTGATDVTSQLGFAKTLDGVQPQAAKEISHSDILNQINKQLDVLKEDTTSKVTIILKPENLGKISVELVNGKEGLTAKMTTDNAQVKELLDKSLNSLKDNLGNQGVSVNNVSVKLNETQKQDNMFSFNEQTNQQQQQNSQNPKQAEENESSFGKEINSATEAETELAETSATGTESSISIGSNLGKVDYKV